MKPLSVDLVIPELIAALAESGGAVLQASPGSGKTSRVPLALLGSPFAATGSIIMLEPRRLAAVNAASWLAKSIGEEVGQTVGYSIRFDRKVSSATRLEVLTEGLLTRRLQSDPELDGVSVVIFDEFHERSLHADTSLAFCLEVQKSIRPDLKLIVMSATLDVGPVSRIMGGVPVIVCEGRAYPVDIRYLGEPNGDVARAAADGVLRALRETAGDILLFLPGAGEIKRCFEILSESGLTDLILIQLYGDLPFSDQERAIMPAAKRKVVLSTNISETSLTIEGVSVVIDSGLARRVQFDPPTGLNRMQTVKVSAASATQRAGRAGRLGPGVCYRLWSEAVQARLLPHNQPEIRLVDLAPLALELASWGIADESSLPWLDRPSADSLAESRALLRTLGALDTSDRITGTGKRMATLPLHPRLARMVLEGEVLGVASVACDLVALLSERDIFRRDNSYVRPKSSCDYTDRLEALDEWRSGGRYGGVLDANACRQVDRVASRLKRLVADSHASPQYSWDTVGLILLMGFPDRVAMQRENGSDRYLLVNGTGGRLGRGTALHDKKFIIAVEVLAKPGSEGTIHGASAVSLEQIRQQFTEQIAIVPNTVWDGEHRRVVTTVEERFGPLLLSSRSSPPVRKEAAKALINAIGTSPELVMLPWTPLARQFQARVSFLSKISPERGLNDISTPMLAGTLSEWIADAVIGMISANDLKCLDMLALLQCRFSWEQLRLIDEGAPTHIHVPSGSRIRVDYSGEQPFISVKLQEMFGLAEGPRIAWGRVPLVIHLLSPAQRPIQVTRDLRSFWETTYPQVKKELKGRYPKHPWPDDPWSAVPTKRTKSAGASKS